MVHGLLEGAAGELFVRQAEPGADALAGVQPSAEDVAAAEWHSGFYVRARAPAAPAAPPHVRAHAPGRPRVIIRLQSSALVVARASCL